MAAKNTLSLSHLTTAGSDWRFLSKLMNEPRDIFVGPVCIKVAATR